MSLKKETTSERRAPIQLHNIGKGDDRRTLTFVLQEFVWVDASKQADGLGDSS
jgi:hypothetical protein